MTPEEEQAIRDSVKWADLPGNPLPLNDAYRTRCDQLLEAMQDLAVANAKLAERDATIATLREALNKTLASATEGTRIAQERITKLCAEIATIQSNAVDNYAAAENRAHEATQNHQEVFIEGWFGIGGISEECVNADNIMRVTRYLDGVRLYMVDGSEVCFPNLPYESVKAMLIGGAPQS